MHELSIACSIVETVEASLPTEQTRVITVFLKIGAIRRCKRRALVRFEVANADTPLEGAKLDIEELPVIVHCHKCGSDTTLGNPPIFRCGNCKELTGNLLQGKEMEIVSVEIEDGKRILEIRQGILKKNDRLALALREHADAILAKMRENEYGTKAEIIGEVVAENPKMPVARTPFGSTRVIDMQLGEQLPRICQKQRKTPLKASFQFMVHPA